MNYQPSRPELEYVLDVSPGEDTTVDQLGKARRMFGEICNIAQDDCVYCDERTYKMCDRVNEVLASQGIVTIVIGRPGE